MAYGGLNIINKWAPPCLVSKHQIRPKYGDEQADAGRDGRTRFARPNSQAGANADRETFIFPVKLTTSRIGNLTRLILTLAIYVMTIHAYIHTYIPFKARDRDSTGRC